VSEAVTLAHLARPLALAAALDPSRYEVTLAVAPYYDSLTRGLPFEVIPIRSVDPARFLAAIESGHPIYDVPTIEGYVSEDLAVIDRVRPDIVVGDCRMSLSVSARLAKVPYLAITNAYWSPHARGVVPMPELPLSRALGVPLASALFRFGLPIAFALHARPLNRVRRRHGLPSLGLDLRAGYTDGDVTLYADVPDLAPVSVLPPSHHYLGPVLWSPPGARPGWWGEIPDDRPAIYATLGSSGRPELLRATLDALADLPVTVLAATVGKPISGTFPPNVLSAPYLPGAEAAARSSLVLCNGGSPTTHQAIAAGAPVLGLAGNMDQHLNMRGIVARGAGLLLRSEHARPASIRAAVDRMLGDPGFRVAAREVAALFSGLDAPSRFRQILDGVIRSKRSG